MVDLIICRLCLESERPVFNIFNYNLAERNIKDKVFKYLSLNISETDSLTTSVCVQCINKIEEFHTFSEQVKRNQEAFKQCQKKATIVDSGIKQTPISGSINFEIYEIDEDSEDSVVDLSVDEPPVSKENTTGKTFACEECGKVLATKWSYEYHVTTHNEVLQSQCELCGKWLKNNICLYKHMQIHSSIRYKCTYCKYSTSRRDNFQRHMRENHSNNVSYICPVCNRAFTQKRYLENHMARHTGEKNFPCEYCDKTFAYSSNYYIHRKKEHPDILAKLAEEKEEKQRLLREAQESLNQE